MQIVPIFSPLLLGSVNFSCTPVKGRHLSPDCNSISSLDVDLAVEMV